jgi:hypothetical protein
MSKNTTPEFNAKLVAFVAIVQAEVDKHFAANLSNLMSPLITTETGRKFVRIVRADRHKDPATGQVKMGGRSVWGFVQISNGDVLKAEGWKKPAMHARGNINNANPWDGMTVWGPHYLK